jgi:CubicO group peptidase (beta-lactamase class C family)
MNHIHAALRSWHSLQLAVCLLICLAVPATSLIAQIRSEKLVIGIDSILMDEVASGRIPGAVVLVKARGTVVMEKAYGHAYLYNERLDTVPVPEVMTTRHLFDIASLTKVTGTTTGIMLLADRGLLKVDDKVSRHVPSFDTPEKRDITIRQLLTHTSGIHEWYPMYYSCRTRQETYALIAALPLRYPPGKQRRYSDLGFTVLGQIIERVSGKPLEEFLTSEVFRPLGMRETMYLPLRHGRSTGIAATSHGNPYEYRMVHEPSLGFVFPEVGPDTWNGWRRYTLVGEVNDGNAWYACGGVSGAAGLFSSAADLQKLVDMLMKKGMGPNGRFLSEKTVMVFLRPDSFRNGLGWMMDPGSDFMSDAPAGSFGHTGFTGTSIVAIPSKQTSLILLVNRQHKGLLPSGSYYNVTPLRKRLFSSLLRYLP